MYTVGLKLKLKPEQSGAELPAELEITELGATGIHVKSQEGTFESSPEILDAFYTVCLELTLETMPEFTIKSLADIIGIFDLYAATNSPLAGLQVKTKLMLLKDSIAKVSGQKPEGHSLLGRKLA